MNNFSYYMPTKLFVGKNILQLNSNALKFLGTTALIITGKNSSKQNGSLENSIDALEKENIKYFIFDDIEENPSLETIETASNFGKKHNVDFCIGIGGGSPMDSAKAIGVLIKNSNLKAKSLLDGNNYKSIPLVAVPTTAGTGSETTPYSVVTVHENKTKVAISSRIFFDLAFLDATYMMDMEKNITVNTSIDALNHLIESYLSTKANFLTDKFCESGFSIFKQLKDNLLNFDLDFTSREQLLLMSSIAGICIAQTGTSLPHGMGYSLTYFHNVPHGIANGILTKEYLKLCDTHKTQKALNYMGFKNIDDLGNYFKNILNFNLQLSNEQIKYYSENFMKDKNKLNNHPNEINYNNIVDIYKNI